jgi:Tol biopolymer transport system component
VRGIGVAAAGILLAVLAAGTGSSAPTHSPPGHIAFTKNSNGYGSIWTMNAFGTGLQRLTPAAPRRSDAAGSTSPAWTLTGTRIAYVSTGAARRENPADAEIWTMRADGSGKRRLTRNRLAESDPAWSPDGTEIAFTRSKAGGYGSLYVMDASEANLRQLTRGPYDGAPAWSPDGRVIAFERTHLGKSGLAPSDVWIVPATGGRASRLIRHAAEPAWSVDGRQLAFSSRRDRFGMTCFQECYVSSEVYIADADGTHQHRVTRTKADDRSPAWSPDGLWLAMSSDRGDRAHHRFSIWLVSDTPPEVIRATVASGWQLEPAWGL